MALSCQSLLQTHPAAWQGATIHPFLTGCHSGSLQSAQFNTWLVQDYLFVKDFTRMVGRVLGTAPDDHIDVLLAGLGALKDELLWFEAKAAERDLDLATPPQPTCQRYCEFMASLALQPYAVQATALWAIEYAYNQGWQIPGPMPPPYTEFADRWGNPGFTDYVDLLGAQADAALSVANDTAQARAEQAFLRVAELEAAFWQMAFTATAVPN
ncbi:MAG: TenA family transcriptional regulator [Leptolyngbya sp. DLM2.Bin27]|nr:MAG: TenA family transcriptional regulator [Leptolyngbya sp. DLM2.Bin27]